MSKGGVQHIDSAAMPNAAVARSVTAYVFVVVQVTATEGAGIYATIVRGRSPNPTHNAICLRRLWARVAVHVLSSARRGVRGYTGS